MNLKTNLPKVILATYGNRIVVAGDLHVTSLLACRRFFPKIHWTVFVCSSISFSSPCFRAAPEFFFFPTPLGKFFESGENQSNDSLLVNVFTVNLNAGN